MSSAIEVLKSKKGCCDLCKYNGTNSCDASEGEWNECKPAEELFKALSEGLLALEKQEKDKDLKYAKNWLEGEAQDKLNKLEVWLEKRIEANQKRLDWQLKHSDNPYAMNIADGISQRITDYKEVLGELK